MEFVENKQLKFNNKFNKLTMSFDPVSLSQDLIKIPSVSGQKSKIIDFFASEVAKIGFKSDILEFEGDGGTYAVSNVHSIYNPNNKEKILYFAGHLDVVATGEEKSWNFPPFAAEIFEGNLYGRGVVDMKCAIACFVSAVSEFLEEKPDLDFGIGLLITGDEEAESINGTKKMLQWMKENKLKMSHCIVGEPTSSEVLGDVVKIGRRGSIGFSLKVIGKQGHVAYPENAINPISTLNNIMKILKDHKLDTGNEFFDPSNLEFTYINAPDVGGNVIPPYASANFNIRFNDYHTSESLIKWVEYVCSRSVMNGSYELKYRVSGESFITKPEFLSNITLKAIKETVNVKSELSTSGGTSDARFIKDFCPVVELGLMNRTAHQIDENAKIEDIVNLKKIYKRILQLYSV